MPSIVKKKIKGRLYYYARETRRVDGRPKVIWTKYLGTAESLVKAAENASTPPTPSEVEVSKFGAVAALYAIAQRLKLVEIIDRHAPKRNQGLSVGAYMLIAGINRCVEPRSKARIGDWFAETPLRRWLPAPKSALSSKRFWDNMGLLNAESIRAIEADLTRQLKSEFDLDLRVLLYDTTNFFTFIDSFNERSTLAQRGKSKEGRSSLRIVGLALMASLDFHLPLFHECYPGNVNDCKQLASVAEQLAERYRQLSEGVEDITLVLDKGNNSQANIEALDKSPFHFVGSLKLNQVPELTEVPRERFEALKHPRLAGVSAYRTTAEVFGKRRTVVVTFNENLYLTQSQSLFREAKKRLHKLNEIRARLLDRRAGTLRKGRVPTRELLSQQVDSLLKGQHLAEVVRVEIMDSDGVCPMLELSFDQDSFQKLSAERLGRTVLFTDQDGWTTDEIILAYRGQSKIEGAFRTMKDPQFVSWSPLFHWTDDKVRVHAFYCILALTLISLLQRELHRNGIALSISALLEELASIREVAITYEHPGTSQSRPPQVTLSKMTPLQKQLFDALALASLHEGTTAKASS